MSFLLCPPTVFVIDDEYEILVNAKKNGIIGIQIDGKTYYEENSGVLSSEKDYAKIRLPQTVLNEAKAYAVSYRESINRRGYYSQMGETQTQTFSFKPLEKTENINLYHIADVHYEFNKAAKLAEYFGDDLDVLIVNGDIGEVETIENYVDVCKFVGEMSKGNVPVLFVRGNHDTRGKLAEKFTDYFPCNGKNTYFTFQLGCLNGVALDCGEDKKDDHLNYEAMKRLNSDSPEVYGGVNSFSPFRQRELRFLQNVRLDGEDKITFAVSHICPIRPFLFNKGDDFDIERECYAAWNRELERLGIRFMVTGHLHRTFISPPNDEHSTTSHSYPVIVGSGVTKDTIIGTAITLNKHCADVKFTDNGGNVLESHTLKF